MTVELDESSRSLARSLLVVAAVVLVEVNMSHLAGELTQTPTAQRNGLLEGQMLVPCWHSMAFSTQVPVLQRIGLFGGQA